MTLTPQIESRMTLTKEKKGRLPRFDTVAKALAISEEDAKDLLNQYRVKHGERLREPSEFIEKQGEVTEPKKEIQKQDKLPIMETIVIKFSHQLQYIGFTVTTIVDFGLGCFFCLSLGKGLLAQSILGSIGLVLTAAKTWGWAYSKVDKKALPVAVFAVVLSIFANTAIFRAEIELQAQSAITTNTEQISKQSPESVLQGQITEKQAELKLKTAARDKIDSTVESNIPMYNTLDAKVKQANKELTELNRQLTQIQNAPVQEVVKKTPKTDVQLDAWSVFRQWTEIDWTNHPRTLAYFFTLFFACLPELVIYATTPRKLKVVPA